MRDGESKTRNLRSRLWFEDPRDPGMTALYLERYLNHRLTRKELQSGCPIIGIAQTGVDLTPCNWQHATGAWVEFATWYVDIIARHGNPRHSY
jgi:dihydroxyacid dehydratase/phosphogluconate dehydratase